jgi:hypothetical protein
MDTSDFYVRQLLLRAAAAGERIAIYSDSPQRWLALSQPNIAVVERRSSFRRSSSTTDRSHTRRRVCRQRS